MNLRTNGNAQALVSGKKIYIYRYLRECQTTLPADNSDQDKSAHKREQVGPCVKTTRTVLLFYNIVQYLYVYNYLFI